MQLKQTYGFCILFYTNTSLLNVRHWAVKYCPKAPKLSVCPAGRFLFRNKKKTAD